MVPLTWKRANVVELANADSKSPMLLKLGERAIAGISSRHGTILDQCPGRADHPRLARSRCATTRRIARDLPHPAARGDYASHGEFHY